MSKFAIDHMISIAPGYFGSFRIVMTPDDDGDDEFDSFRFSFYNTINKKWYGVTVSRDYLCDKCWILYESEELLATLEVPPAIECKDDLVVATFQIAGRNKTYPMQVTLTRCDEPDKPIIPNNDGDDKKIESLQTENSDLRGQVAALEERMAAVDKKYEELAGNISVIAHHLLTMHSSDSKYNSHLEKYPAMLNDAEAYSEFNAMHNMSILTHHSHEPLFRAMVDAKVRQPLIDMIVKLESSHICGDYITIMLNVRYLLKSLSPFQMETSSGISLRSWIDWRIKRFTNIPDEWRGLHECIVTCATVE